jgi:nucleotide-binding universal stress UspA family protein
MKIVIGTDLSEDSLVAVQQGLSMAECFHHANTPVEVYVAYVEGHGHWYPQLGTESILDDPDNRRRMEAQVEDFLDEHLSFEQDGDSFEQGGEEVAGKLSHTLVLEEGRAEKKLAEIVDRLGADWLVVGMSGQGALVKLVAGSTTEKLANHPVCNMAIAHPRGVDWNKRPNLLVGVDFSDSSNKALNMALDLAELVGARLHIVNVVYPPGPVALPDGLVGYAGGEYQEISVMRSRATSDLEALVEQHHSRLEAVSWTSEVIAGYPTRELVGYAEDNDIDAIVLGTVGRSAVDNFLLGSVARGVVKHMPCTVCLTPPAL